MAVANDGWSGSNVPSDTGFGKAGLEGGLLDRPRSNSGRTIVAVTFAFLAVGLFVLPPQVHALDPDKRVTQYIHKSWRTQDGSLPAGMFSITQTSDGFLWFLSLPGDVYRSDGVRFQQWHLPAGTSNKTIGKIVADGTDGLWIASNELMHLKKGAVASQFALKGLHGFQSMIEDTDGSLWLGLRSSDAPLCHATDRAVKCFGKEAGLPISYINAVMSDGSGGFWLGGMTALVHWNHGVSEVYPTRTSIASIARAPDGTVWVGMDGEGSGEGLAQLKQGTVKSFVAPDFDGSKISVTSLLLDHDGNLWVGTDAKGLFRIHGNHAEHYGRADGLSADSVWALFEDREGIVWAGSTSGIDSFRDPRVTTFSAAEGLGKDLAAGILASRDGAIWVGNSGSLDRIKDGAVTSIRKSNGLPGYQVAAMLQDHAGNMWVGVDDGLYLFKSGQFHPVPGPNRKPFGMVVGITEDVDGNIWAECASNPRTLVRIRDFEVREVFPASQVPPGHNLFPDPHGGIWIETLEGDLLWFRNGILETKIPRNRNGSPLHPKVMAQADGSVLVGTENGIVGWRRGNLQRMTTKNGLPCDFIITFIEDKEKHWWLYTRCGVIELSDSEMQRWWADPEAILQTHLFDLSDGAQPNIGSFNQAACTPDGRVWFASGVVVQVVDPSKLSQKLQSAETQIESVTVDRRKFAATDNLKVGPHPRDLQIDYTSATFSAPQKVTFRYRLAPYDREWHEAGTRRQAFYTDLPPGKYTFQAMAGNADGVWSETAASLSFSVSPAYYQTAWFRTLCAALFLALLWAIYQWRLRQLRHQFEMTLDARVAERTRIARELHDTLLQSAHGLLLRFQTVSQLLPARPQDAKEKLDAAIEQTAKFVTEARDEVQGMRDSLVEGNNLAVAISTLGQELATSSERAPSPDFQVTVEGASQDLRPIIRDEIYKIAAEALRNVFRHAHADRIEVEIRYNKEEFRLRVRDDGKGIDPTVLAHQGREGHYGLHGMRERAAVIGGKLTVWSEVDGGTEVELCVPTSAYAAPQKRSWPFRKFAATASQGGFS